MNDALRPTGRDCWCGFPTIIRDGVESCSVYGSHPDRIPPPVDVPDGWMSARPLVDLIVELDRRTPRHLKVVS